MRAVDMGASRPTQDMVQEHIFNQARTEQRAEELRRLQATCIPELTAMLDRVRQTDQSGSAPPLMGRCRIIVRSRGPRGALLPSKYQC